MMDGSKAIEIIDDCAESGVKAIQFTGGGEPTLHKSFKSCALRVINHGMTMALVSNGVRMTKELAEVVVCGSWVRISLDAANEETYTSTRRVHKSHWVKAQDAIRYLRAARDRMFSKCVIGVGFVVTPDNWKDIVMATQLAKDLGADNIRISAQFSSEDEKLFEGFHKEAVKLCSLAEKITDDNFKVYNRFGDRLEDLRIGPPEDRLCGYQFFTTYIGADLNVYRCCGYAYNERGLIGSIANQRFKNFWMSHERFDNQMNFDGRGCERCQFRRINSALAYVLDPAPQLHEEFV